MEAVFGIVLRKVRKNSAIQESIFGAMDRKPARKPGHPQLQAQEVVGVLNLFL